MDHVTDRQPSMGRTALFRRRTAPERTTDSGCCQGGGGGGGMSAQRSLPLLHQLDSADQQPPDPPSPAVSAGSGRQPAERQASAPADMARHQLEFQLTGSTATLPSPRRASDWAQRDAEYAASQAKSDLDIREDEARSCRCSLPAEVDNKLQQLLFDTVKKLNDRRTAEVNQRAAEQARRSYCSMMEAQTSKDFLSVEVMTAAHEKALKMAVDMFECLREGNDASGREVLEKMKSDIAFHRIHYVTSNELKSKRPSVRERLMRFTSTGN